jgi:phenylpropionate dioxygenase-like ring-hydroxylating dioxygenase large terminal subunit
MIPNQWYPLLETRKVGSKPVAVTRMGEKLVLWRDGSDRAVCMRDRCPHRGVALSRGKVVDGELQCPYHGFRFESGGDCVAMPCEGPDAKIPAGMRAQPYPVREAHGLIWLFWGESSQPLPEIPWFDEAGEHRRGGSSASFTWPVNFARSVETNFDIHHTPFVHGRTLPGIGSRLDPYTVETEGNHIITAGQLRKEDADRGIAFRVEFKVPSITYFEFGKLAFLVADCPVDEDNTWRYAIYYQDYVTLPGLRWIVSWLSLQLDWKWIQLRQDLRMVETFQPKLPQDHLDRLVRADAGTAAYRKLRRKLIDAAQQGDHESGDPALRRVS